MANSAALLQSFIGPSPDVVGGLRNKLINGQFDHWQRTTSFPAPGIGPFAGLVGFAADRWQWQVISDGGLLNGSGMTRMTFDPGQPDVPEYPTYFMRWQLTSITGGSGNAASNLVQRIESAETLNGAKATFSFWMRGDVNGTIATSFLQFAGSGGSPSNPAILPTNFTVTANTWTFHRLTVDVPSTSGFVFGASGNDGFYVRFHNHIDAGIATNQNFPSPISYTGNLDLANVQLEEGDIASPEFDDRERGFELQLCQRYYEEGHRVESTFGNPSFTPSNEAWFNFKVTKRDVPTIFYSMKESPPTGSGIFPGTWFVQQANNPVDGFMVRFQSNAAADAAITTGPTGDAVFAPWTADAEL